jgi:hypothetical protein
MAFDIFCRTIQAPVAWSPDGKRLLYYDVVTRCMGVLTVDARVVA